MAETSELVGRILASNWPGGVFLQAARIGQVVRICQLLTFSVRVAGEPACGEASKILFVGLLEAEIDRRVSSGAVAAASASSDAIRAYFALLSVSSRLW